MMEESNRNKLVFIEGNKVILRPLLEEDFTSEYLTWLNDPFINQYSQRRPFPVPQEGVKNYNDFFLNNPQKGFVLAIIEKPKNTHIGSISLVNIQLVNRCAEIAILIGKKEYWNGGYGAECIYLLTKHAFINMNLHKIFAGSFNPAFIKCVEYLGWKKEGEFRERIWSNGRYHNQIWMSILRSEFRVIKKYDREAS
jgi:RimJ/RimL family protein N-acetyltransferase